MAWSYSEHREHPALKTLRKLATLLRTPVAMSVIPTLILFYNPAAMMLAPTGAPAARVRRLYVSFARPCLLGGGTEPRLPRSSERAG